MFNTKIYDTLRASARIAVVALAFLAAACTVDDPGTGDTEHYSPLLPASGLTTAKCPAGQSRAAATPFDIGDRTFYSFDELYPTPINPDFATIGVVLKRANGGDDVEGNFYYKDGNRWETSVNVKEEDYYLFGFMPASSDGSQQLIVAPRTDDSGTPMGYAKGAVITVTNFPALTAADVSVVVGVLKAERDDGGNILDITEPTIISQLSGIYGKYEYEGAAEDNFVYMLLDHLYANVNFELYVDKDYSALRRFVLTGVEMTSNVNNLVNLEVEVGNSEAGDAATLDPVKNITLEPVPGTVPAVTQLFPLSSEGSSKTLEVDKEVADGEQTYTSIPGYFAPADDRQAFTFTFTFDVYDTKGNLVRKGSKASNTWSLSAIQNPTTPLSHGVSYSVKVKIKPTYIYQLGDADLDTPTLEVTVTP